LVGAIASEANVPSKGIGPIRIAENFSVVEVPDELADGIIAAMRGAPPGPKGRGPPRSGRVMNAAALPPPAVRPSDVASAPS
jgi:hypothetical protein